MEAIQTEDLQESLQEIEARNAASCFPISEITPFIFVGSWRDAHNPELLREHRIRYVLNLAEEVKGGGDGDEDGSEDDEEEEEEVDAIWKRKGKGMEVKGESLPAMVFQTSLSLSLSACPSVSTLPLRDLSAVRPPLPSPSTEAQDREENEETEAASAEVEGRRSSRYRAGTITTAATSAHSTVLGGTVSMFSSSEVQLESTNTPLRRPLKFQPSVTWNQISEEEDTAEDPTTPTHPTRPTQGKGRAEMRPTLPCAAPSTPSTFPADGPSFASSFPPSPPSSSSLVPEELCTPTATSQRKRTTASIPPYRTFDTPLHDEDDDDEKRAMQHPSSQAIEFQEAQEPGMEGTMDVFRHEDHTVTTQGGEEKKSTVSGGGSIQQDATISMDVEPPFPYSPTGVPPSQRMSPPLRSSAASSLSSNSQAVARPPLPPPPPLLVRVAGGPSFSSSLSSSSSSSSHSAISRAEDATVVEEERKGFDDEGVPLPSPPMSPRTTTMRQTKKKTPNGEEEDEDEDDNPWERAEKHRSTSLSKHKRETMIQRDDEEKESKWSSTNRGIDRRSFATSVSSSSSSLAPASPLSPPALPSTVSKRLLGKRRETKAVTGEDLHPMPSFANTATKESTPTTVPTTHAKGEHERNEHDGGGGAEPHAHSDLLFHSSAKRKSEGGERDHPLSLPPSSPCPRDVVHREKARLRASTSRSQSHSYRNGKGIQFKSIKMKDSHNQNLDDRLDEAFAFIKMAEAEYVASAMALAAAKVMRAKSLSSHAGEESQPHPHEAAVPPPPMAAEQKPSCSEEDEEEERAMETRGLSSEVHRLVASLFSSGTRSLKDEEEKNEKEAISSSEESYSHATRSSYPTSSWSTEEVDRLRELLHTLQPVSSLEVRRVTTTSGTMTSDSQTRDTSLLHSSSPLPSRSGSMLHSSTISSTSPQQGVPPSSHVEGTSASSEKPHLRKHRRTSLPSRTKGAKLIALPPTRTTSSCSSRPGPSPSPSQEAKGEEGQLPTYSPIRRSEVTFTTTSPSLLQQAIASHREEKEEDCVGFDSTEQRLESKEEGEKRTDLDVSDAVSSCTTSKGTPLTEVPHYGRILVHCRRGISRSAAIVVAYLMAAERLSYQDVVAHVTRRRSCVSLNLAFQEKLTDYTPEDRWFNPALGVAHALYMKYGDGADASREEQ